MSPFAFASPAPVRSARLWATALLCGALAACGGGGGGGDDGGGPAVPECAEGESYASTFEGIQKVIFERQGCTQDACHGSARQGGLELTADVAYDNVYEVRALGSSLDLIEPGDEERSFLWLKVAASTRPGRYQIAGSPMPNGLAPLSEDELELLRLWIYAGAPRTGNVQGSEELLAGCLPPAEPIEIEPLDPPQAGQGFQIRMPEWPLAAGDEFEGCFATYYDITDQVPADFRDPSGTMFRFDGSEVRQDPQSHHLFLYYPFGNFSPGGVDVTDPAFGRWTCRGGASAGQACDPKDLSACGEGLCASELRESFACIGYGPASAGNTVLIGGAGQPVSKSEYHPGVFAQLPMTGVIYWNSHAFNLTATDGTMNAAINYYFADDQRFTVQGLANFSAIFRPNAAPYTTETYCNDSVLPQGARLFSLSTHTHKRGKRTWITHPDGTMIYENFSYSDPVQASYDPPLEFDSPDPAERTLRYCGTYNNGVAADGSPDPTAVTRLSRLRQTAGANQPGGTCTPVACVSGRIGAACQGEDDDASCDSSPGAGDGDCDACRITGGESTENEMFNLFGLYYIAPEFASAAPADAAAAMSIYERSLETAPVLPSATGCGMGHGSGHATMH
jgi:hypothetical protein